MQKFEGVAMRLLDAIEFEVQPWKSWFEFGNSYPVGENRIIEFLNQVSSRVLSSREARQFPDAATFGFFCRETNIRRYLSELNELKHMRGIGTVLHIAPGNIPINFAYSLVMGLLSGNSNILRLPTKNFDQATFLIRVLTDVANEPQHLEVSRRIMLFRSDRDSKALLELVGSSDGLVVWGGDATVEHFQMMPRKAMSRDVMFPSRVSTAILSASAIKGLSPEELDKLALGFYHDTYLVDQNACSSPSQVVWIGDEQSYQSASSIFWKSVAHQVNSRYSTWSTTGIEKLLDIFRKVEEAGRSIKLESNSAIVTRSRDIHFRIEPLRFGAFAEVVVSNIQESGPFLRSNEQTLTYFGVDKQRLFECVSSLGKSNVERIVPVGKALDIGLNWDGKDTLVLLSRRIELS
jgi:hypothetical protein